MTSNFKKDLLNEQKLGLFLDDIYAAQFGRDFKIHRITDTQMQYQGIDLEIHDCRDFAQKKIYFADEKAQLDYLNKSLPTFAFELSYLKKGEYRKGWLTDEKKRADYYFLVTSIFVNEANEFSKCKITSVNRQKLLTLLEEKGLTSSVLEAYDRKFRADKENGKILIKELNARKEGYIFSSKSNKAEQPINLVLRLKYLISSGVGKVINE